MAEVVEHPLLMSGPLVVKTLAGLKNQTRRLITRATSYVDGERWNAKRWAELNFERAWVDWGPSPAGNPGPYLKVPRTWPDGSDESTHRVYPQWQVGDRIWVRETFVELYDAGDFLTCLPPSSEAERQALRRAKYRATDTMPEGFAASWKPSIFMPRWASRLTLEVTSVRVERLNAITEADAKAEGVTLIGDVGCPCEGEDDEPGPHLPTCAWSHLDVEPDDDPHRAAFAVLWDQINGKRASWASDPWVFVIGFRRVEQARSAAE